MGRGAFDALASEQLSEDDGLFARHVEQTAALRRQQVEAMEATLAALDVKPAHRPRLLPLPANSRPLTGHTQERRQGLRRHLQGLVASLHRETPSHRDLPTSDTRTPNPILLQACGTCRGSCCNAGGDRAFLNAATLHRVVSAKHAPAEDLVELYLSYVPDEIYVDSCVFHAAQGCGLPGDLRSSTCHDYLCSELYEDIGKTNPKQPFFAIASDRTEILRTALFDGEGSLDE